MPLVLLNKPFRVLSQFTDDDSRRTLAEFIRAPGIYPCGRLDYDSEGLLLLTDDGRLQARISHPRHKVVKGYWAQVEGSPSAGQLAQLEKGVRLKDGPSRAVSVSVIGEPPGLWQRDPPIRFRKNVSDTWIDICLDEGRNRQVRRTTAAVGLPTLRLIRYAVGPWSLNGLLPGEHREIGTSEAWQALKQDPASR